MLRIPKWCHLLHRHHGKILLAAAALTIAGGYFTSRLSIQSDLADLLPDDYPSIRALHRMQDEVGAVGQLRIVLETADFQAARRLVEDLEPKLRASPLVNYVDYKNDVEFYEHNALLLLDTASLDSIGVAVEDAIEAEKQRLNPLLVDDLFGSDGPSDSDDGGGAELRKWEERFEDLQPREYYTNDDSTVVVVKVFPNGSNSDFEFIRRMLADVQGIVESVQPTSYDPQIKVYYGGNFKNRLDELDVVKKDILGTAVYGVGGIFLLIVVYFRRLLGAALISGSLLFSLAWTFGLTYLVIGELNTITGFLFVILFGLGVDYGIHAFARYVESRRAGMSCETAVEKMVCSTGTALTTTAVTTAAAFFSLTFMDFKGFSDLGFIAGVGILFALIAMLLVLPSLIILFERLGYLGIDPVPSRSGGVRRGAFGPWRAVLTAAIPLTLAAAYAFTRIDFEYDFTNLRAITEERRIVGEKTEGIFRLSESPAVILADSREDLDEIVRAVEQRMHSDTSSPTIDAVRSVFSLVPADQGARLAKIAEIRELVEDEGVELLRGEDRDRVERLRSYLAVTEPFTWDDFPERDKRQFIAKSGEIGNFVFVYPSVALRDGRNAIDFRDDVGTVRTESGKIYHAASSNIISAEMLLIMIREGRVAGLITLGVVFVIVLADFRSLRAALLVLSPLVIGVVWMGGIMYLSGMKFNFFNIVVFPSVIGIGVDNGVHIYHRYLEEGAGSLPHVLRNTGLAVLMTTLTTIVGYSGLIMARHPGLNSIGDLAVAGIAATFVSAVLVLPAVLQLLELRHPPSAQGPKAT